MRRVLLASVAILALSSLAHAADLSSVLKAPAQPGYPYAASGFYFGVGTSATAASASVADTGLLAAGAGLDGVVGYQWQGGLDFMAVELDATYTNIGNSGACTTPTGGTTSCAANDSWEIEPLFKFGFPVTTLISILPNLSSLFPGLPSLPSGVTATNVHPYIYAGAPFRDVSANYMLSAGQEWQVQPEIGAGMLNQWQSGLVIDLRAGCSFGNTGFNLGTAPLVGSSSVTVGTACTSRVEVLY